MTKRSKQKREVRVTTLFTRAEKDFLDTLVEPMGKENISQVIRQLVKDKVGEIDANPLASEVGRILGARFSKGNNANNNL